MQEESQGDDKKGNVEAALPPESPSPIHSLLSRTLPAWLQPSFQVSVSPGCFFPKPPSALPAPLAISAVRLASLPPQDPAPPATSVWQESPPQTQQVSASQARGGPCTGHRQVGSLMMGCDWMRAV